MWLGVVWGGGGDCGRVWESNREGRVWESTAGVGGREGAVCGHLDPCIGAQHLCQCRLYFLLLCPSKKPHLNLSPEVLSPQLWEPADLDSWEACG